MTIRTMAVGFDLDKQKKVSYGLASMEERVNEIGGAIQIYRSWQGDRINIRFSEWKEEEGIDDTGTAYSSGTAD